MNKKCSDVHPGDAETSEFNIRLNILRWYFSPQISHKIW